MVRNLQHILTIIAAILFVSAFILDLSQFGEEWNGIWTNFDAGRLLIIIGIILIAGLIFGLFLFQKRNYKKRLLLTIPIAFILFSIADFGNVFINKYGLTDQYNYFTAKRDIKNGKVQFLVAGLIDLPPNDKELKAEETLRKQFGYKIVFIGCMTYPGVERYNAVVEDYLKKRNGKDWEIIYQQKLDSLRRDIIEHK